jgi:hypothetical protein
MRTAIATRLSLLGAVLSCSLAGCGDDIATTCGEGTELVARECVPLEDDGSSGSGGRDQSGSSSGSGAGSGAGSGGGSGGLSCGESAYEVDGRCEGLKPIGAPCESGEECAAEGCLQEDRGALDGYCTLAACSDNRPCPAGSHCTFSSRDAMTICLAYCDAEDDCRDGYECQPLYTTDVHVCAPTCTDESCPSGTYCREDTGTCVIDGCVPGAEDACSNPDHICYPDRRGLTSSGGVCLPPCDPSAEDSACADNEVCQPLPEDPDSSGICAPPVCETTEDCPAGSACAESVCVPPARCDGDGACADEAAVCVGGAGGRCMPACPEDGECADLHSGLSCSAALSACLPTGSFPGSACRSDLNSPCDSLEVLRDDESTSVTGMVCADGLCVASCDDGGSDLCADISDTLSCAVDVLDVGPVCLPNGSYPGGPCGAADACAPLVTDGGDIPTACKTGRCLVTCDAQAGGDVLCEGVDASLVCADNLFGDNVDVCLPRGSIPGGPCAAGDRCDAGMACEDDRCLYDCTTGGQAVCDAAGPALACATGIYATPVCLPRGSFPGGPCRSDNTCDENLGGLAGADMICMSGVCAVQCQSDILPFASGDALCATVNAALTCVTNPATDFCAPACVSGACPTGRSCLGSENACLPTGSFLGSPCASGACSGAPMLVCAGSACAAGCTGPVGPSAYCDGVGTAYGTGYDTCNDVNPHPVDELLICVDAP